MNIYFKRIAALVIDFLLIGIPVGIVEAIFSIFRSILYVLPILHIFSFLFTTSFLFVIIYTIYETVMMYYVGGTVGKKIMKLETVCHTEMTLKNCLIRGGLKALSLQIWVLGVANAAAAYIEPHRSIHDYAAGTEVW